MPLFRWYGRRPLVRIISIGSDQSYVHLVLGLLDLVLRNFDYRIQCGIDEQELRIVSGEGRNSDAEFEDVPFHPRELVAVYFGARAAELRAELEPIVFEKYPHAQCWQASQGKEFQIDFTHLDKMPA